ncbi:hypothetical protein [Lentilitoribacter sp. Alg239-R112]|uniref:hypothetical protein n=1 Tax=Lentilitoribacter sp. Alg239-R112 TaxID=2305987 RepID=UPI0013A6CD6A|nr:hypothetical protein [Lentilitoribacter sp. Alg239-R112]
MSNEKENIPSNMMQTNSAEARVGFVNRMIMTLQVVPIPPVQLIVDATFKNQSDQEIEVNFNSSHDAYLTITDPNGVEFKYNDHILPADGPPPKPSETIEPFGEYNIGFIIKKEDFSDLPIHETGTHIVELALNSPNYPVSSKTYYTLP